MDVAAVDAALKRLWHPTTVRDRLAILQTLVEFWHGPIRPEDGMTDAEMTSQPLPLPLQWWYRFAGKRTEILSTQNHLLVPRDFQNKYRMLQVVNGRLLFYVENQGVYQWSTLRQGDDPPVFGRYEGRGRWAKEGVTLSEHLILACLFEAVTCHAKYKAFCTIVGEPTFRAIVRHVPPLAIGPWRWIGAAFFAARGAFMDAHENGVVDGTKLYSVSIGAQTAEALHFLKPITDKTWDYSER